ncbi:hypothetical protein BCR32DRAFT_106895 [Anaeromyces robustus]|uniref:UDENN domain-containing protein n=1 Tax=Anaeromyces robustus TaxID=1754192 RepID=A0A1Y1XH00_9FUNG|nr:hypothetical protein BCR32DRAFT_106895 [Anaeromyces robustus]|eukprot:ORX85005.1 hypothetical protein BCR32DRAFT_106895 [Anaeromyces robustus]
MTIIHVICVAFHHRNGPIIEYVYPPFPTLEGESTDNDVGVKLPKEWKELPFFCLPDGAHKNNEDFVWFHLPPVAQWTGYDKTSFFGISCYRQIASDQLINKTPDITRSTVQKAVLVITQKPIFGSIREKLNVVTQTFFEQKDFSKMEILSEFHTNLNEQLSKPLTDSVLFNGTSLKTLVHSFRLKTLTLYKLFFLEKRIIFFGSKVETLCSFQYSLISLFPDLIRNLQNVASPALQFERNTKEIINRDNREKVERYGMPLSIFGKGCFFQPYIPLQQIDMLTSKETTSYIVGTSNAIFLHNKECNPDVIVNVDDFTLEFRNKELEHIVSLTPADRKFIDEIIKIVDSSWDDGNNDIMFDGSDPSIRSKFELYLFSLLYSIKLYTTSPSNSTIENQIHQMEINNQIIRPEQVNVITQEFIQKELLTDFNLEWLKAWMDTKNYNLWEVTTDSDVLDVPIDGHPCKGSSAFDGVEISLRNTIKDLNIDKKMEPLKQGFNSVLTSAESTFAKLVETTKKRDVPSADGTTAADSNNKDNRVN